MATRNDIDSTEKLLNLIRKGPSQSVTEGHAPRRSASPLWTSLRNRVLPFRSRKVMGLEILRDSLHIALSEKTRSGWRLLHASSVDIPADMTVDTPEFKDFLQNQLQDLDPRKTAEVWFALPASRGEIWSIRIPRVKKGMDNVLYWSARKAGRKCGESMSPAFVKKGYCSRGCSVQLRRIRVTIQIDLGGG